MMKRYFTFLIFAVLFVFSGCAGSSRYMMNATPIETLGSGKSLVYFMRPSGMGFAINFQIWDSDHFVGLSQAKSYFAYECNPGKHLFLGFAENKVALEADLAEGKSYYVGTGVRMGVWKARLQFTPVTRGSELWDQVEGYKRDLKFIAVVEEKRAKWEAEKKAEAQGIVEYFTTGEGQSKVQRLGKEHGR